VFFAAAFFVADFFVAVLRAPFLAAAFLAGLRFVVALAILSPLTVRVVGAQFRQQQALLA
ncbi:MAG TPA: hypothetical protein VIE47_03205, partial [Methylocystis sp.]